MDIILGDVEIGEKRVLGTDVGVAVRDPKNVVSKVAVLCTGEAIGIVHIDYQKNLKV